MAEVDTSIYQNQKPINPLAQVGQAIGIQRGVMDNRLTQQNLDMRQGLVDATQQSIDPQTGLLNNNKFLSAVGSDPRTAWIYGDVNAQTQSNSSATSKADVDQLNKNIAHVKASSAVASSLLANPNLGKTDLTKEFIDGMAGLVGHDDSYFNAQQAAKIISEFPKDPRQQAQAVSNSYAQMQALSGQLENALPKPVAIPNGSGTTFLDVNPVTNRNAANQSIQNQLGPEFFQNLVPIVDPTTKQTIMVPRGVLPMASGQQPNTSAPQAAPAPTPPAAAPGPLGTGRMNATPVVGGAPIAAQSPAQIAAQGKTGAASGEALANDEQAAKGYPTRMGQLREAYSSLQGAGSTGPGTVSRNQFVSAVQSLPWIGSIAKAANIVNPDEIADFDKSKKYMTQYALSVAGGLGPGTNEKILAATSANPNLEMSKQAASDILKYTMAIEKMHQAAVMSFQASNEPEENYNKFVSKWGSSVDPRAFAVDEMKRPDLVKMVNGMNKNEYDKFEKSYHQAIDLGLIQPVAGAP